MQLLMLPQDLTKSYSIYQTLKGEEIPTVNVGSVCLDVRTNSLIINRNHCWSITADTDVLIPQHLYLWVNVRPKQGEYFIEISDNEARQSYQNKIYYCDIGATQSFILTKDINFPFPENCKKIYASTDSSLGLPEIPECVISAFVDNWNYNLIK